MSKKYKLSNWYDKDISSLKISLIIINDTIYTVEKPVSSSKGPISVFSKLEPDAYAVLNDSYNLNFFINWETRHTIVENITTKETDTRVVINPDAILEVDTSKLKVRIRTCSSMNSWFKVEASVMDKILEKLKEDSRWIQQNLMQ